MITLLKLGGSLITDKNTAHTIRQDVLDRLAEEIYEVWSQTHDPLIIGHGSGSFGHIPAKKFRTRDGVQSEPQWAGFAEVHAESTALNHIVTNTLRAAGLPVISFVPMDNVRTNDGIVSFWDTHPIKECLSHHLIPIIFGDVIFDDKKGGTILSTEDLFVHLCETFSEPPRILLAGLEEGVWRDFPRNTELLHNISADNTEDSFIQESVFTDVTGGMHEKVRLMKSLVRNGKIKSALIFSGEIPGNMSSVLDHKENIGTLISNF